MRSSSCRVALAFIVLLAAADGAQAQTTESLSPSRPLNLSLPRESEWTSTLRNEATPVQGGREAAKLPDLGGQVGGMDRRGGHLPYGSGYEARRGNASAGEGSGRGGGVGRGR